jgi:hypothetical protein
VGVAAVAAVPAVAAVVDQHAAAIRTTLTGPVTPSGGAEALIPVAASLVVLPTLTQLAAYVRGLTDQATAHGWYPPMPGAAQPLDRISLRILAACQLARTVSASAHSLPSRKAAA